MALISPRWLRAVIGAAAITAAGPGAPVPAQAPARTSTAPEYQVKAVFLFNFAQFVEWPAGAFADSAAPLVIGVLGEDPFGPYLDETVRGETIDGRPLAVRRYRTVSEVDDCHILFVQRNELDHLKPLLQLLRGRSVLTVSDGEDFALRGGMIRFLTDRSRIRLRINLEAAREAGLTLSSKLLRPAEIVTTGED
jgi:hypothetical protein